MMQNPKLFEGNGEMRQHIRAYTEKLSKALTFSAMEEIPTLSEALHECWKLGRTVYLCGNGGSAGNAMHLANDFLYGAGVTNGGGLKVEALSANASVVTSLANDIGYEEIFAEQLKVKADAGDVLIALSGSGNSGNVVKALEVGNSKGMKTFAILGYSGGDARKSPSIRSTFRSRTCRSQKTCN